MLFKVVPVTIYGANNTSINTFAFLDDGSQLTLIEKSLFDRLGLIGEPESIQLQWTKGITREEKSLRSTIVLSGDKRNKRHSLINVYTIENLDLPRQSVDATSMKTQHRHLRGLSFSSFTARALEVMKRSMKMVNGRYEIGLLWKHDNVTLPDSNEMAFTRLKSLEKSLLKKPSLLEWNSNHVRELIAKGYAREATAEDLNTKWPRVWYCPTFIVHNENKLTTWLHCLADSFDSEKIELQSTPTSMRCFIRFRSSKKISNVNAFSGATEMSRSLRRSTSCKR